MDVNKDTLQNSSLAKLEAQMFTNTEINKLKKMPPPQNYRRRDGGKFHTDDSQILGAAAQNSIAEATWHPRVLHSCII